MNMKNLYEKIPQDIFVLDEIKIKQQQTVDYSAHALKSEGAKTFEMPYRGAVSVTPHEDLLNQVRALKPFFADYFGYTHCLSVASKGKFSGSSEQLQMLESATESLLMDITINGFSFNGKDKSSAIIKGMYKGCAMNTKPMHFSNPNWGEKLLSVCEEIQSELYQYLFEGKVAQLDMFDNEENKADANDD